VFAALDSEGTAVIWGSSSRHGFPESAAVGHQRGLQFSLLAVGENFVLGIQRSSGTLMEWIGKRRKQQEEGGFVKVPELVGKNVVDIAACGNVSFAIVSTTTATNSKRTLYMRYSCASISNNSYTDYCNSFSVVKELVDNNISLISVGSTVRACVDNENNLFTWGENRNGALGLGKRSKSHVSAPTKVSFTPFGNSSKIVSIDCTRGQPNPKNKFQDPTGQEGPRIHLVTENGKLWIAGTCHKGLGADHLGKTMTPKKDHLEFYPVGGKSSDNVTKGTCLTGCLDSVSLKEAQNYFLHEVTLNLKDETKRALLDCGIKIPCDAADEKPNETGTFDSKADENNNVSVDSSANDIIVLNDTADKLNNKVVVSTHELKGVTSDDKSRITNVTGIATNYLLNTPIVASVASHIHSFALSANGELFGFGCGSNGRLGTPYFFKHDSSKRLMKCYVSTPSRVGAVGSDFRNKRVLAISVGKYWSFAIVEE